MLDLGLPGGRAALGRRDVTMLHLNDGRTNMIVGNMTVKELKIERFSVISSKPFETVIAALKTAGRRARHGCIHESHQRRADIR